MFYISGALSDEISEYVKSGLTLCFTNIIGSVFPFMIITDFFYSYVSTLDFKIIGKVFERIFKINGAAFFAFLCGIICGFPIGVKVSKDLYVNQRISKEEYERLIGFANNTSPAFVISGVGAGMRRSVLDGVILYFSMVFAAIISGIILSMGKKATHNHNKNKAQNISLDFSLSIKKATENTLTVCSYVVIFSVFSGVIGLIVKSNILYSLIISFLEVGNSSLYLANSSALEYNKSLILTSFGISFSGLSVFLQSKSIIDNPQISLIPYFKTKLLQGIISAVITTFFIILIPIFA